MLGKHKIKAIKDKYPKGITGRTDIAPLPDWVTTAVENYRFNQQLPEHMLMQLKDSINAYSLKLRKDLLMKS